MPARHTGMSWRRWTCGKGTVVCDDRASGGAGFYPINLSGDLDDVQLDDGCVLKPRAEQPVLPSPTCRVAPKGTRR